MQGTTPTPCSKQDWLQNLMRLLSAFPRWGLKISKAKDHTTSHYDFSPCVLVDFSWLQPANLDPCPCTVWPAWLCSPWQTTHTRHICEGCAHPGSWDRGSDMALQLDCATTQLLNTRELHTGHFAYLHPGIWSAPKHWSKPRLLCWYTIQHFPSFHSTENTPERMHKWEVGIPKNRKKKATQSRLALRKVTESFDEQELPDRALGLGARIALCC